MKNFRIHTLCTVIMALLTMDACTREKLTEQASVSAQNEDDCEIIETRDNVSFKDSLIYKTENGKRYLTAFTAFAARPDDPDAADSKTSVDPSTGKVSWVDGDAIRIFNGKDCIDFIYDEHTGTFQADGLIEDFGKWTAYYPASICRGHQDGKMMVELPAFSLNSMDRAPMMCNRNASGSFILHNMVSILKLKVTGDQKVRSVTFKANDPDIAVCGEGWFDDSKEELVVQGNHNEIIYLPEEGIQLSDDAQILYFQIPAHKYEDGFTIHFEYSDNLMKDKVRTSTLETRRGAIVAMKQFRSGFFSGGMGTEENPYQIASEADLNEMSDLCNNTSVKTDKFISAHYVQTADINMANTSSFKPICPDKQRPFTGFYSGLCNDVRHKIYNLNINNSDGQTGLFGNLGSGGSISGVHITAYEGFSSTIIGKSGTGAVVGYINSGNVSDCRVVNTDIQGYEQVGGVFGIMQGVSNATNCTVDGSVTVQATSLDAGGITGRIDGDNCSVSNCTVRAAHVKVTQGNSQELARAGGIAGSLIDGAIINCASHAILEAKKVQVGGICGTMYGRAASTGICRVLNCVYSARTGLDGQKEGGIITSYASKVSVKGGGITGNCSVESGRTAKLVIAGCHSYPDEFYCNGGLCSHIGGIVGYCNTPLLSIYDCTSAFYFTRVHDGNARISNESNYPTVGCVCGECVNLGNSRFIVARGGFKMGKSSSAWGSYIQVKAAIMEAEDSNNKIAFIGGGTYSDIAEAMKAGAEDYNLNYSNGYERLKTNWVKSSKENNCCYPDGYYVPEGLLEQTGCESEDCEPEDPENIILWLDWQTDSPSIMAGTVPASFEGTVVDIKDGGSYYPKLDNKTNRWYITIPRQEENVTAWLKMSKDGAKTSNIPMSQIRGIEQNCLMMNPRKANCAPSTNSVLTFTDFFSDLDLVLSGAAKITSIKLSSPDGMMLSGENGQAGNNSMSFQYGRPFVVLNTSQNGGVQLSNKDDTHFHILLAPGTYQNGLDITICDSDHRVMKFRGPKVTFNTGKVLTYKRNYRPDENIVWYEGFDRCVWGGDCSGNTDGVAYAPTSVNPGITGGMTYTGYETDLVRIDNNWAGNGYMSTDYHQGATPDVSDSYMQSRGFDTGTCMLFRCQEMQGAIALGYAATARGIFETTPLKNIDGVICADVEIRFKLKPDFNKNLALYSNNAGRPVAVTIDGQMLDTERLEECWQKNTTGRLVIPTSLLPANGNNDWHTLTVSYEKVTNVMSVKLLSENEYSGKCGIFVDEIKVVKTAIPEHNLRILYWNIQYGMWADQGDNYNNFVNWVKKYDPDICIWCEAKTKFNANSSTITSSPYLPDNWNALAKRYGHNYTAIGGNTQGFPQVVTAKYPISTILKMTDMGSGQIVTRDAGYHTINVNGITLNIVTLHLWPFEYDPYYQTKSKDEQAESASRHEGATYSTREMQYILNQTVNNPQYSNNTHWIVTGDSNSWNPLDIEYYKADQKAESTDYYRFWAQKYLLENTNLKDAIRHRYTADYANTSIDIFYVSDALFNVETNAMGLIDEWTKKKDCSIGTIKYTPSDHIPIMVDFML